LFIQVFNLFNHIKIKTNLLSLMKKNRLKNYFFIYEHTALVLSQEQNYQIVPISIWHTRKEIDQRVVGKIRVFFCHKIVFVHEFCHTL